MADAPKLLGTDTLRQAYPKFNQAIDNANEALSTANTAKSTADSALTKSNNTQTQLDTVVINGDSSVEAAQARVTSEGKTFSTLQERLNYNDQLFEDENEYILYSFFKSNSDLNTGLFVSSDGENLKKINTASLNLANLRDPSICYYRGWYLIAYTGYNPGDFKISKSKDLINWTTSEISLGFYKDTNSKIWAPEFFIDPDSDKLYILISNREGTDIVDIEGATIANFKPYIAECTNVETLAFSAPIALTLEAGNKIDPCAIKHNGEYYLFIKDEYDKNIESWKSPTITGVYTKISDNIVPLSKTEGPSIIKFKDTFFLYTDSYKNDQGLINFATSTDLVTWSSKKLLKSKNRLRHGSAFVIQNDVAKNTLRKFINANFPQEKNTKESAITLSSLATNNEVASLDIIDEMVYSVSGSEQIKINAFSNPYNAKRFYFYIASNSTASIEIVSGSGIVSVPSNTKWEAALGDGDTLIEIVWVDALGSFKPVMPNMRKFVSKSNVQPKLGWKRVDLSTIGLNQSALPVEDGVIYVLSGSSNATISGVASLPDGSRFGLAVFSGTAQLTVTTGTNITVPNGSFIIGASNNNNESVIEFVKVPSSTFRLKK